MARKARHATSDPGSSKLSRIGIEDLSGRIIKHISDGAVPPGEGMGQLLTLDQMERRHIDRVLKLEHGNKTRAAKLLGIDRRTLYRKLGRSEEPLRRSGSVGEPDL
jgi:DNA-binding NtrC family response regulator